MDFTLTEREAYYSTRVREFIETHIRPRVADYKTQVAAGDRWQPVDVIEELKPKARAAGLWNLFMPPGGALQHVDESFDFQGTRPISSAQRAYSRLVSWVPSNSKLSSTWRSA